MEVRRGDIFYVAKYATQGSEPKPEHPAVIVSNDIGNTLSKCVEVVYLTSKEKRYQPTHAAVLCRVPSTAMCENNTTVSKERLRGFIRQCTEEEMREIDKCLLCSLALDSNQNPVEALPALQTETEFEMPEDNELQQKLSRVETERDCYKEMYLNLLHSVAAGSASR